MPVLILSFFFDHPMPVGVYPEQFEGRHNILSFVRTTFSIRGLRFLLKARFEDDAFSWQISFDNAQELAEKK